MTFIICCESNISLLKRLDNGKTLLQNLFDVCMKMLSPLLGKKLIGELLFFLPNGKDYDFSETIRNQESLQEAFKRIDVIKMMSYSYNTFDNLLNALNSSRKKYFSLEFPFEIFLIANKSKNNILPTNFNIGEEFANDLISIISHDPIDVSSVSCKNNIFNLYVSKTDDYTEQIERYLSLRQEMKSNQATLNFGQISSPVILLPEINHMKSVCIRVIGFLNASDAQNPPTSMNCAVISTSNDKRMLLTLYEVLFEYKVVALAKVEAKEAATRYAFLHPSDGRGHVLLLSICRQDCSGYPWLGQIKYLAPLSDFGSSSQDLYPEQTEKGSKSPFPVRSAKISSYNLTPFSSNSQETKVQEEGSIPIFPLQYTSWVVNENSFETEVNKVIRLIKRLPEKPNFFFKELRKIQPLLLGFGYEQVIDLIVEALENHKELLKDNESQSQALLEQINKTKQILNR